MLLNYVFFSFTSHVIFTSLDFQINVLKLNVSWDILVQCNTDTSGFHLHSSNFQEILQSDGGKDPLHSQHV
jgi:hypothetical protein